jgi:hypothetical protein
MAGHAEAQLPVHALMPEPALSLSKKYAVKPLPSTTMVPSELLAVATSLPDAAEPPAAEELPDAAAFDPEDVLDAAGVVEHPASARATIAAPARVRKSLDFMIRLLSIRVGASTRVRVAWRIPRALS